ncbi:hypothetical protein HGP28_16610 [Vibrio sp. SM6]|uniref:Uncharacterized protein n=1 Tax=Vibrio agarilyticus TaxID=2726741 RepID=A0A7X8TTH1_9VIBR|nr:hypothetical protein [Vibrio agarilyticus]NLS14490.1 hypothetical protein [Vibrio agarilyticus]
MSKIAIAVKHRKEGMKIFHPEVQFIRHAAGVDYQKAKDIISSGAPFYFAELYMNDHVDIDEEIREILQKLNELGLGARILEIMYDESWEDLNDENDALLDEQVLINMLDEAVGDFS